MKKNLRLLCLGLASAIFTCGFAQEDMTSSLKNADMEQALKGWSFGGAQHLGKNTKNPASRIGFHGMNQGVLEAWNSNAETPLGDSYVMQKVKGLPNGTYVFGAYAGASKQTKNITESNRDTVEGVWLFANDAKVAVRTDNPDMAYKYVWAHTSKFNVATQVTDGTLLVGLKVEKTTANYVVWDNATLYYFGEMDEATALDKMAQIDMDTAIAIADTLIANNIKMELDTLWLLDDAIKLAKASKTTAESLWDDNEALNHAVGLARRSAADYVNLKKDMDFGSVVLNGKWTESGKTRYGHALLQSLLSDAQGKYETSYFGEKGRDALEELRANITRQAHWLRVDSFEVAREALKTYYNTPDKFTGEPGKYTEAQKKQLENFDKALGDTLSAVIQQNSQDKTKAKPESLYPFIAQTYAFIDKIEANPIPLEFTEMPISYAQSKEKIDGYAYVDGSYKNASGLIEYNSPVYRFQEYVNKLVITVPKSSVGNSYFCLSELAFYDASGNKIPLTKENIETAYDHNTINPNEKDGQGIEGLIDGKTDTYFHSAWKNIPAGEHTIKVTLPGTGYNTFSFTMISRSGQNWQFPASMEINLPSPKRDAMMVQLQKAKDKAPYIGTDPGFFKGIEAAEVFEEINAAIVEAETMLANNASEADMPTVEERLKQAIFKYEQQLEKEYKEYNLPDPTKKYRIISAFSGFLDKQQVEKAITLHKVDTTLWWSNVAADSLQQEFVFEPYLDADGDIVSVQDGDNVDKFIYSYKLKHVQTGFYVDSIFKNNQIHLAAEATDTVKIKTLGRGQWNILVRDAVMHVGDHNGGNAGTHKGAYGGTAGVGSGIVSYGGGIDGQSAWFIREIPVMPYEVAVTPGNFKSAAIHFAATNQLTLTAEGCTFEDLVLYDLYGAPIACDVVVEDGVATVATKSVIASCVIAFNNTESVEKITVEVLEIAKEEADWMSALESKFESVSAIAPEQGAAVGQYNDITEYLDAIDAAENILENGADNDEEVMAAVAQLDSAVAHLKNPHLPEAGKYYFVVSGLAAFEKNLGYNVALYPKNKELHWQHENILDSALCWQFEPATVEELYETLDSAKAKELITVGDKNTIVNAFYIKNFSTGEYVNAKKSDNSIALVSKKESATLYKVTMLNSGSTIALDNVEGGRIHAEGHSEGRGKSGRIVYYGSGAGTASAWRVVETENDFVVNTEIDLVEAEPVKVVKGVYDLFGRRLAAPTAPGIYIIDGVKRVIK